MSPVLLIAANFLRQRRWFVLIYPLLAVAFAFIVLPGNSEDPEILKVYFLQLSVYAITIATLLASQADFNERKSRRVLGVLSKGIERRDYLAGLLCGVFVSCGLFLAGAMIGTLWIAEARQFPLTSVLEAVLLMWLACCLCATITTFLATFLHPLLAIGGTSLLAGGGLAAHFMKIPGGIMFPVVELGTAAQQLVTDKDAHLDAIAVIVTVALLEIVVLWLLAGRIFERRDIAVAIE
jgi:ABC-type transport system involved in multi-copper enzyme maturation permease subunit